jgi:hypothetical protein
MDVLNATRAHTRGLFLIPLVAGIIAVALAGTAHAAPAKVVHSTPAQVAKLNSLIRSGHFKATTAQSTTTLTVGYGCDQFAVYVSLSDGQVKPWMDSSGGYGYLGSRFYIRRAPTWLNCQLGLQTANGSPINHCDTTVEVGGTDAHITGWTITYRQCFA